ncbi:MAG: sigma-70 family RNA polymerase sigma factor, partial [Acidobacteriota bacterium]
MSTHAEALTTAHTHSLPTADLLGDPDAFADLIDEHKHPIVNYLTRLVGDRDRAEDLAQETFVRLYQHRHRYREVGHLAAFLFRIATNLVASEERRKKRWRLLRPVLVRDDAAADGVATVPPRHDPEDHALAAEERHVVTRAISRLPLDFRAPLVLREIEGLSYRDIADALELSEGTVKSRLH